MAHVQFPGAFTGRQAGGGESELSQVDGLYVPDDAAKKRVEGYLEAGKLLDPKQHMTMRRTGRRDTAQDTDKFWIPVEFAGMLVRLMRHYTLGEEFAVRAVLRGTQTASGEELLQAQVDAQTEIDRITEVSDIDHLLRQLAEQLPALGDGVLRIDLVDEEDADSGKATPMAKVRYVKPHFYFPTVDPTDGSNVVKVTLAWTLPDMRTGERVQGHSLVLREIHEPGTVEYKLNVYDGRELGGDLALTEVEALKHLENRETGIDEIPVIHFGYNTQAGEHFGNSELARVKDIILALENRLAQEDEVLEKHARPKLIVGPGVLDGEGRTNLADFDVIEVTPDIFEKAVKPDYLTWDMQIQGIQHEIEKLEEYLFMTTETSPASFGLERDGSQVESARALRFKAHRTVNKVQDVRSEITPGIKSVYRIAQKLELAERKKQSKEDGYRWADVDIRYGDPIVEDQEQEVLDYVARKNAGLVSRRRALMDLDNLPAAEAEAEAQEILQDQVDEAAATTATLQPLDFGATETPAAEPTEVEKPEEKPDPTELADDSGLGVGEDVQKVVLNGAQVSSMVAIVQAVAENTLPRDSALAIIETAFGLDEEEAEELLGSAGTEEFEVPKKAPAPPFAMQGKTETEPKDEKDEDKE